MAYGNMLNTVINVVNSTIKTTSSQDQLDEMIARQRDPVVHQQLVQRRHEREDLANKAILAATGLAVAGEVVNVIRRSDTIKNLIKR